MTKIGSFEKYLKFERRYSNHTVVSYLNDLDQFRIYMLANIGMTDESLIRHVHIRSWIVHLMKQEYTAKSINRKISTLKSYFKYLKKIAYIKNNPTAKVIAPKIPKRLPKVVRADHMEKLFRPVDLSEFEPVRDQLIIDILYSTGMRRSELINLKMVDVNTDLKNLKVLGKGNKERLIPISNKLITAIEDYKRLRIDIDANGSPYLILTKSGKRAYPKLIYSIVSRHLATITTADKRGPHTLRHSFATHMASQGAELNAIKEILGHANLSATEIYMHNSIDRLKEVYQKSHPKASRKI